MTLGHVDEAVSAGARQSKACEELELDPRTVQRWKRQGVGDDGRAGPKEAPKNKLSQSERRKILAVVNQSEYRNLSIKQIVPKLGDLGEYYASESTMYRVLREFANREIWDSSWLSVSPDVAEYNIYRERSRPAQGVGANPT